MECIKPLTCSTGFCESKMILLDLKVTNCTAYFILEIIQLCERNVLKLPLTYRVSRWFYARTTVSSIAKKCLSQPMVINKITLRASSAVNKKQRSLFWPKAFIKLLGCQSMINHLSLNLKTHSSLNKTSHKFISSFIMNVFTC